MSELTIRAYNVRFGDAFLISIPEGEPENEQTKHILIDCGNIAANRAQTDVDFEPIWADIDTVLAGKPLDLYILSHAALDHLQGLVPKVQKRASLKPLPIRANYAWFTASLDPHYAQLLQNRGASAVRNSKRKQELKAAQDEVMHLMKSQKSAGTPLPKPVEAMYLNHEYGRIQSAVTHLQTIAPPENTFYLHRESENLAQKHPFQEATFEIWGPEFDLAHYKHPLNPVRQFTSGKRKRAVTHNQNKPIPPAGVDASAFYNLVNSRNRSAMANLTSIDESNANSSLVFCLNWQGWHLLFPGDALLDSWQIMAQYNQLKPVHFLKVSNHLGYRGTPQKHDFDTLFPAKKPDRRKRMALASTYPNVIHGTPSDTVINRFEQQDVDLHIVAETLGDVPVDGDVPKYKAGYLLFKFGARRFLGMEKVFLGSNEK